MNYEHHAFDVIKANTSDSVRKATGLVQPMVRRDFIMNILKATGDSNTIEGIPTFLSSSAGLTVKDGNMYISGSGNYLNLHGTSHTGEQVKFQVEISGGLLKIVDQ